MHQATQCVLVLNWSFLSATGTRITSTLFPAEGYHGEHSSIPYCPNNNNNNNQTGVHPSWLEFTKTIEETMRETIGVTVGQATVDWECSERQTRDVLCLVGYHDAGSLRK